jgi:DNA-binding CsgD family transcriptional regulator
VRAFSIRIARNDMGKTKQVSKPAGFTPEDFERLFLTADYAACRALLERAPQTDANAVRAARLDNRAGRFVDAVERLAALKPVNPRDRLERDLWLASSYAFTQDFDSASRLVERVLARTAPPDVFYYGAIYRKAHMAWVQRDLESAERLVRPVLKSPDANQRAIGRALLSWTYGSRGLVHKQIHELLLALEAFDKAEIPDAYVRLNTIFTLGAYARELPLNELADRVRAEYAALKPASGTRVEYFKLTRLVGWIEAVRGNELAAFRMFRKAAELAPTDHWRVLCMADRAYLARATGERAFASDQLHAAHELASRISWNDSTQEDRMALLNLADLFAEEDPALAHRYIALFRSLRTPMDLRMGFAADPRVRAFENFSAGLALLRLGETEDAREMLEAALETFERFEYGLRAALCALALYRAGGERRWLTLAKKRIAAWPNNWVAREVRETAPLVSRAQQPVLQLVLQGMRNAEIARALGRSPHTVRNHIAEIFKTFGVRSRSELIARLGGRKKP